MTQRRERKRPERWRENWPWRERNKRAIKESKREMHSRDREREREGGRAGEREVVLKQKRDTQRGYHSQTFLARPSSNRQKNAECIGPHRNPFKSFLLPPHLDTWRKTLQMIIFSRMHSCTTSVYAARHDRWHGNNRKRLKAIRGSATAMCVLFC